MYISACAHAHASTCVRACRPGFRCIIYSFIGQSSREEQVNALRLCLTTWCMNILKLEKKKRWGWNGKETLKAKKHEQDSRDLRTNEIRPLLVSYVNVFCPSSKSEISQKARRTWGFELILICGFDKGRAWHVDTSCLAGNLETLWLWHTLAPHSFAPARHCFHKRPR